MPHDILRMGAKYPNSSKIQEKRETECELLWSSNVYVSGGTLASYRAELRLLGGYRVLRKIHGNYLLFDGPHGLEGMGPSADQILRLLGYAR